MKILIDVNSLFNFLNNNLSYKNNNNSFSYFLNTYKNIS